MEENHQVKNSIKSIVTLRSKLKETTFFDELKKFKEELNVLIQQKNKTIKEDKP